MVSSSGRRAGPVLLQVHKGACHLDQALVKDNMGWSGWEEFRNLTPNDKTN